MRVFFSHKDERLWVDGAPGFSCHASVPMLRLANNTRAKTNIARTIPGGFPYDPHPFPVGKWRIFEVRPRSDKYRAPFFIATNAYQEVKVWEVAVVNGELSYTRETDRKVIDAEYGIHFSEHPTTQGCIKIHRRGDLEAFVSLVNKAIVAREKIDLEVIE